MELSKTLRRFRRRSFQLPATRKFIHSCERAVTAILAALVKIESVEPSGGPTGREEQIARAWLVGEKLRSRVDPARFARLGEFID